jgi:MFS transporter, ACS family, glucarate transporter
VNTPGDNIAIDSAGDSLAAQPTRARYGVLAFLCSLSFVLYIDRACIGKAVIPIQTELDLNEAQMGYALAAFVVAYGLFEVPTGRWGDRFGSRGVLARIVIWWSFFTALTGAATGLGMLIAVRFLFGAGEAGAFPNAARVIARWFPLAQRGTAQGMMLTSAQLGAALSAPIAQMLIDHVGWRWSFVVFGGVGIAWAAAFYGWFRDEPGEHPAVNDAELALIERGRPPSAPIAEHPPIPWRSILTSSNIWLLGLLQTCSAALYYMFIGWYPTYLQAGRGTSAQEAAWLSSLVLSGAAIGCLGSGYINDLLARVTRFHPARFRIYGFLGTAAAALALVLSVRAQSPVATSALAAVACIGTMSQQSTFWAVTTEISGRHLGVVFGLMNSLGVPGAALSTIFLGQFVERMRSDGYEGRAQWDPAFYVYAGVLFLGACCWLAIDARQKVPDADAPRA